MCLWNKAVYGKSSFILTNMDYKKKPIQCRSKKKYKILCITVYVKSKQNGHEYSTFSESVVKVW